MAFIVRQSDSSLISLFLYYMYCLGDFQTFDICCFYICWARHYPPTYINNKSDLCLRYFKPGLINPLPFFGTLPRQNRLPPLEDELSPFCIRLLLKALFLPLISLVLPALFPQLSSSSCWFSLSLQTTSCLLFSCITWPFACSSSSVAGEVRVVSTHPDSQELGPFLVIVCENV